MLEPLPQGMHDRRVSSAESEARQDWPSKPTEDSEDSFGISILNGPPPQSVYSTIQLIGYVEIIFMILFCFQKLHRQRLTRTGSRHHYARCLMSQHHQQQERLAQVCTQSNTLKCLTSRSLFIHSFINLLIHSYADN